MKVGTSIFLLVVILIAFGYVTSDDQHTHADLRAVNGQLQGLQTQSRQQASQLTECQSTLQADKQLLFQKDTEITTLRSENWSDENTIANLQKQISDIQHNNKLLQSGPILAGLDWESFLLLALLLAQLLATFIKRGRKPGGSEYIRLTPEERMLIINMRRKNK